MAYRRPPRPTDRIDYVLGILTSVGVACAAITLMSELAGQPAVAWAAITGAIAIAAGLLYRRRLTVRRKNRADRERA